MIKKRSSVHVHGVWDGSSVAPTSMWGLNKLASNGLQVDPHVVSRLEKNCVYLVVTGLNGDSFNNNADCFPWQGDYCSECDEYELGSSSELCSRCGSQLWGALLTKNSKGVEGWRSWRNKPACVLHKSDSPSSFYGKVLDTFPDESDKTIQMVLQVDSDLIERDHPGLLVRYVKGYATDVSQGSRVGFSKCSKCGNLARTEEDYCYCLNNLRGRVVPLDSSDRPYPRAKVGSDRVFVGEICYDVDGAEVSFVHSGACDVAKVVTILKEARTVDELECTASILLQTPTNREEGRALLKVANTIRSGDFSEMSVSPITIPESALEREPIFRRSQGTVDGHHAGQLLNRDALEVEVERAHKKSRAREGIEVEKTAEERARDELFGLLLSKLGSDDPEILERAKQLGIEISGSSVTVSQPGQSLVEEMSGSRDRLTTLSSEDKTNEELIAEARRLREQLVTEGRVELAKESQTEQRLESISRQLTELKEQKTELDKQSDASDIKRTMRRSLQRTSSKIDVRVKKLESEEKKLAEGLTPKPMPALLESPVEEPSVVEETTGVTTVVESEAPVEDVVRVLDEMACPRCGDVNTESIVTKDGLKLKCSVCDFEGSVEIETRVTVDQSGTTETEEMPSEESEIPEGVDRFCQQCGEGLYKQYCLNCRVDYLKKEGARVSRRRDIKEEIDGVLQEAGSGGESLREAIEGYLEFCLGDMSYSMSDLAERWRVLHEEYPEFDDILSETMCDDDGNRIPFERLDNEPEWGSLEGDGDEGEDYGEGLSLTKESDEMSRREAQAQRRLPRGSVYTLKRVGSTDHWFVDGVTGSPVASGSSPEEAVDKALDEIRWAQSLPSLRQPIWFDKGRRIRGLSSRSRSRVPDNEQHQGMTGHDDEAYKPSIKSPIAPKRPGTAVV